MNKNKPDKKNNAEVISIGKFLKNNAGFFDGHKWNFDEIVSDGLDVFQKLNHEDQNAVVVFFMRMVWMECVYGLGLADLDEEGKETYTSFFGPFVFCGMLEKLFHAAGWRQVEDAEEWEVEG